MMYKKNKIMPRADIKQSYTPNFKNTPKFGKPQTRMPGGGSLIGDGMIQGKEKLKINNPKGKNEGKNEPQKLKKGKK